jgi:hypothetical protein
MNNMLSSGFSAATSSSFYPRQQQSTRFNGLATTVGTMAGSNYYLLSSDNNKKPQPNPNMVQPFLLTPSLPQLSARG